VKPLSIIADKIDRSKISLSQWRKVMMEDLGPVARERFPGYKKGTFDTSGTYYHFFIHISFVK